MKKKLAILLTLVALVWIVPAVLSHAFDKPAPQPQAVEQKEIPTTVPLNADRIFDLVNEERKKGGLKPLSRNSGLDKSAQIRAEDMVTRDYFSHFDPVTGEKLVNVGAVNPGLCSYASENIEDYRRPAALDTNVSAVENWMNSPLHREAILDDRYDLAGISIVDGMIVQHFCDL